MIARACVLIAKNDDGMRFKRRCSSFSALTAYKKQTSCSLLLVQQLKFESKIDMIAAHPINSLATKEIASLDFTLLKLKLQDAEEGEGWSAEYTDVVHAEYLKFLELTRAYPDRAIVPSGEVDMFWHYHILDTRAYQEDCQAVFGHFLHHFPYFGMRGEEDASDLRRAWADTTNLYRQHFGEPPDGIWLVESRCPNCGRSPI